MAKDPAMLWYWGDWYSGTVLMNRFLKGCYMDVLHAQFNHGPLSLDEVKTILAGDFEQAWPVLQKKFIINKEGLFYNERLEFEKNKRKNFTESRKSNRTKKTYDTTYDNTYDKHMIPHMENENENENKDVFNTMPVLKDFNGLPEIKIGSVVQLLKITKQTDISKNDVIGLWEVFKVQNLTGKKFYANDEAVYSHFINWSKTQKIEQNGTANNKLSPSAGRAIANRDY